MGETSTREDAFKSLILCNCEASLEVDAEALSEVTGLGCSKVHSGLCQGQSEDAARAIAGGDAIICCTQEQAFFEELAADIDAPAPAVLDLRDRAGWSTDQRSKLPKMAALAAEALMPAPDMKTADVLSEGLCLVVGPAETALAAAAQLAPHLSVTALVTDDGDLSDTRDFDIVRGTLRRATGAFGQFEVTIDALQQVSPGGRGERGLSEPRDGGRSQCDLILDLTGGTPLFPAHEKRDGYLRPDPKSTGEVAAAVLEASHMVGTFEKPLYVRVEPLFCAHSRANQTGCTNCLDVCPTGAIVPGGDHVVIDPMVCAGCGSCAALCPSGAISYDAPSHDHTIRRVQTLASAYLAASGTAPRLLVVNEHGSEMIRLAARYGAGLPADVIPLEVTSLNAFGHAEALSALAAGFVDVWIVPGPTTERPPLEQEIALAVAIAGDKITLLDEQDPDLMVARLYDAPVGTSIDDPIRPMGTRRQITRQAARSLLPEDEIVPLPENAPYGAVVVNSDSCTLCLSCVSLCPSGALGDNPDQPQLRFQEDACLQCGLCSNICPENAISYEPRLNLTPSALEQVVLQEEEPFACVDCGALFGVKSTIERITEKLTGSPMYQNPEALRMIQMCDNCRVSAQYHAENSPLAGGERPRVRTTEDYLSKRRDH
ncbi:4Fe-4S binding protein [Shimia thalassica]|uniref:4Fe-4S binding protein n=1 Tax=Shimia thalassica TaxID=1715693 RepID=UPI0026E2FCDC|nr:4Fe-4S binding protein [Shimia thalassica]MDO6797409.1 4Fe-4S binding protein [Shimia thalassica]